MAGEPRHPALRDTVFEIDPYVPGLTVAEVRAEHLGLDHVVKLGSNETAIPPSPSVVAAIVAAAAGVNRYPDPGAVMLRAALAERHRVQPEQVIPGNGADELIRFITQISLEPGRDVVYPWPGFPTYGQGAAAAGAGAVGVTMPAGRLDLARLLAAVSDRTALVCVANPNNPTGAYADPDEIVRFLDELPERVLVLLDEAYFEYVDPQLRLDGAQLVAAGRPNVVALRTLSKAYGLAGLRVGYAVAAPDVAAALNRVRTIFNVNHLAQVAALAALADDAALSRIVTAAREGRSELGALLDRDPLRPYPSHANFVFADVLGADGHPSARTAKQLADRLLEAGVIIRRMDGFGAPGSVRVSVGDEAEMRALADALPAALAGLRG